MGTRTKRPANTHEWKDQGGAERRVQNRRQRCCLARVLQGQSWAKEEELEQNHPASDFGHLPRSEYCEAYFVHPDLKPYQPLRGQFPRKKAYWMTAAEAEVTGAGAEAKAL